MCIVVLLCLGLLADKEELRAEVLSQTRATWRGGSRTVGACKRFFLQFPFFCFAYFLVSPVCLDWQVLFSLD